MNLKEALRNRPRRWLAWPALASGVVVVILAASLEKAGERLTDVLAKALLWCIVTPFPLPGVVIILVGAVALWALVRLRSTQERLKDLEQRRGDAPGRPTRKVEKFQRFEDIVDAGVEWGYVDFWPTAFLDRPTGEIKGIGVDIFNAVFDGIETRRSEEIVHWSNMLELLMEGRFDVLVTPVYETRERKDEVAFCSPLFYSDIGLFVRADDPVFTKIKPMTYEELSGWGGDFESQVSTEFIRGELHAHLSEKLFSSKIDVVEAKAGTSPDALLDRLRNRRNRTHRIQFIERWQGERVSAGVKLKNLLRPGELIFPVSFVVRPEDDTLRRYINLRLLEIGDHENGQGIHTILLESCEELRLLEGIAPPERLGQLSEFFRRAVPAKLNPERLKTPPKPLDFPQSP